MKRLVRIVFIVTFFLSATTLITSAQTFCKLNGNVIIYSNYDGGYLNINIDQDIPNLKIGVTTYEDCEVKITGTYVSDVVQVIYAGYQGDNQHCTPSPTTTSVLGVSSSIVTILQFPPANWSNPYGYPYIICNYSCDSANYQGGCNTPDQISYYYLSQFGGSLYYHFTQYGCWTGTYNISSGGNCCIGEDILPPQFSLMADFTASDDTVCIKAGVLFTNTSYNSFPGAPEYNWDFGDGSTNVTTTDAGHGYTAPGNYIVTLTMTDSSGVATDTQTMLITVIDCSATAVSSVKIPESISILPNPVHDELIITLPKEFDLQSTIELIDETGKIQFVASSAARKIKIDVSSLPRGMYLLRIISDNSIVMRKVILQ